MKVIWLGSLLLLFAFLFLLFSIDEKLATDIVRSLFNGEASIGFWMKHGMHLGGAICIGIACSTYDILSWFFLFRWLYRVYPQSIRPLYDRLYGEEAVVANAQTPWLIKAHRIGAWIYRSCVPQPDQVSNLVGGRRGWRYYRPLILYGLFPGSIWTGVGYALAFRLSKILAFLVLSLANSLKIIVFGLLALHVNVWLIVIIIFAMPFIRKQVEKSLGDSKSNLPSPQPALEPED